MAPRERQEHGTISRRLRNIEVAACTVRHLTQASCDADFNEIVSHVNAAIRTRCSNSCARVHYSRSCRVHGVSTSARVFGIHTRDRARGTRTGDYSPGTTRTSCPGRAGSSVVDHRERRVVETPEIHFGQAPKLPRFWELLPFAM